MANSLMRLSEATETATGSRVPACSPENSILKPAHKARS